MRATRGGKRRLWFAAVGGVVLLTIASSRLHSESPPLSLAAPVPYSIDKAGALLVQCISLGGHLIYDAEDRFTHCVLAAR